VVYGDEELRLPSDTLAGAVLLVQFVAVGGALALAAAARRYGARRTVLASLVGWVAAVGVIYTLPAGAAAPYYAAAALVGFILGGTQALSRSLFSQMVPAGREAAFFGLYETAERGTAWLGTLAFGLALQLTGSYRSAIAVLVVFFVLGFVLLRRVDLTRAIVAAGNPVPASVTGSRRSPTR
jgi:UMF1 family MFS transporter